MGLIRTMECSDNRNGQAQLAVAYVLHMEKKTVNIFLYERTNRTHIMYTRETSNNLRFTKAEQRCRRRSKLELIRARPIFATMCQITAKHRNISRKRLDNRGSALLISNNIKNINHK